MELPSPIFDMLMIIMETFSGLYPALNKMVGAGVENNVLIRILVFLGIALVSAEKKDIASVTEISFENIFKYLFLGSISFGTIYLTQNGIKELPVETNLMIQRSFPIISTVLAYSILGNHQPMQYLPLFLGSYIIMLLILWPKPHYIENVKKFPPETKKRKWDAMKGLIGAAFLTCITFLIFRLKFESYETGLIRTNVGALFVMIGYFIYTQKFPNMNVSTFTKLVALNLCIGYTLNRAKFFMRDSVPEVYYAIFVFLGTSIAFLISEVTTVFKHKCHPDFVKNKHEQQITKQ